MKRSSFLMSLVGLALLPFVPKPKKQTEIEIVESELQETKDSLDGREITVYYDNKPINKVQIRVEDIPL